MRIGVHCSVRNGFTGALDQAVALGCETFQMFTQSPRGWRTRVYGEEEFKAFRAKREKSGITPVVVHSPYLPNLCTSDAALFEKSADTLIADLDRCEKLGAEFLVLHPGAYSPGSNFQEGLSQFKKALDAALKAVPGQSRILIENVAGGGRRVGSTFKELSQLLNSVEDSNRIGICFDTCHATGAGYDLSSEESVARVFEEFEKEVGLRRVYAFHVNDSKGAVGSHRDLHQHLGKGFVGLKGFKAIFNNPGFKNCVLILETPKDTPYADPINLKILRSCLPSQESHG